MRLKRRQTAGFAKLPVLGMPFWKYIPFLVLAPAGGLQAQGSLRPAPSAKLAPALQATAARKSSYTVRVSVPKPAAFQQWARQHLPAARVSQPSASPRTLAVSGLNAESLAQLAACPLVDFVDVSDRWAREERQLNNSDLSVNAITAVHARFPELAGQGLTVSVKERPFDPNDTDFKGRVLNQGDVTDAPSSHATAMATLIGGAGNSHPLGRGVARQVRLATSDFARLLPDDDQQLAQAGVTVQNHSYGVDIENYYGVEAQEYDRQTQQFPELVHVFSSGNSGTQASSAGPYAGLAAVANLTGQFKMSKNTLTVGATDPSGQVAALSSRGPAHDGRVKPELVAYGEGGSSESAALVSGLSLLLQQVYRDQHNGHLPPAALVKAALLNSADDLGRPEVDFVSGFGQADALGAITTLRSGRFFAGAVAQGAEQVFQVSVPTGQQQLKATLVWSDAEAPANAPRALVNDLDLELVSVSTGQRWQPWVLSTYPRADSLALPARRRPDHLNNVEQITLAVPAPGPYELHVRGYSVPQGPQPFSVAYEFSPQGLEWLFPSGSDNLKPGAANLVRWQWNGPAATARLEYRPVGRAEWRVISPAVDLTQNRFSWSVPDTTTLAQLRFVAAGQLFPTDAFLIAQMSAVRVGYTCADETLLQWPRVPGATDYQVYQLGATALEPLVRTTDSALVLTRPQMANRYYAVAPVIQGKEAEPGGTIDYTTQGTACYFRSFRPRQLVTDAVTFDLEIGSTYRLRSVTLERLGSGGYEPVRTIAPVRQLELVLPDQLPGSGRYEYRVRLETTAGQTYFSQVEEVYYVPADDLLVFPNPVVAGTSLRLIAGEQGEVRTSLYDALGRLQRAGSADGAINNIDTTGLLPGVYLLRIQTQNGRLTTRRIVVL
ncbi:S8 family serine peptidase [Hymenobacter sp. BT664]|uniref:S8 family serine peptidase n=1 Tax=Hymenobacter montanus TaxID=2771359 RepID=A0A927BHF3_9BACT|nr:S8 family serine peptidase [Hymenobacter montanus]MBD2770118.1 S8 family serine peptidase [Hymenobacter montanus]